MRSRDTRAVDDLTSRATRAALSSAVALTLFLAPNIADAQRCPAMTNAAPSLADVDPIVRLAFIQHRLHHGAARSRIWALSWSSAYTTVAAAELARAAFANDPITQIEAALGAGSSALGVGFTLIMPPTLLADSERLEEQWMLLSPGQSPCALLADAERYLVRDAENQAFGIGWFMQAVTIAYNVGLGLIFGFVFHDWVSGGITIGTGVVASELMILTQPTDAIDALRRYRAGDLRPRIVPSTSYWIVAPDLGAGMAGLRVGTAF